MKDIRRRIPGTSLALMLLLASLTTPGCDSGKVRSGSKPTASRTPASSQQANSRLSDTEDRGGPSVTAEQLSSDRIYIDSVPRGATVKLVPKDEGQGSEVELGTTPLVLDPAHTPSMRFLIMMKMDDYLKAIEPLKELQAWTDRFRLDQRIGGMMPGQQDYFEFDTPTSQVVSDGRGGLVALGPVYDLQWPTHHRLVALFIPKGVRPSVFYRLMPPPGTFELDERSYGASLRSDYQFSAEQEADAVGSLSRCGKYVTTVRLSDRTDVVRLYSLSAQRGYFISSITETRAIPGYDDRSRESTSRSGHDESPCEILARNIRATGSKYEGLKKTLAEGVDGKDLVGCQMVEP